MEKLRSIYLRKAELAESPGTFLHVVEAAVGELYDHHATLGANDDASPQLVPSGTELWAQVRHGRAFVTEVRRAGAAAKAGIRAGDEVLAIDGVPVEQAIARAAPKALSAPDPEADDFTLRTLLAGTRRVERVLEVRHRDGVVQAARLSPYRPPRAGELVTWRWVNRQIGYIRIENSLGESGAIRAFDDALKGLAGAEGLIFDLRDTPSGGNTDVAEPILGRFIAATTAYQRVFEPGRGKSYPRDSWVKTVDPRGPHVKASLVVLVDHWTGSMGEGLAIAFDALHRAKVVGTPMACLRGGTGEFILPNSRIPVHFPIERLYQLNGAPREAYVPDELVDLADTTGDDTIFERGLEVLERDLRGEVGNARDELGARPHKTDVAPVR